MVTGPLTGKDQSPYGNRKLRLLTDSRTLDRHLFLTDLGFRSRVRVGEHRWLLLITSGLVFLKKERIGGDWTTDWKRPVKQTVGHWTVTFFSLIWGSGLVRD